MRHDAVTKDRRTRAEFTSAKAYSAACETSPLASDELLRPDQTASYVQIEILFCGICLEILFCGICLEILFCGICHSDLHKVRDEWREAMPLRSGP
jgi:D-arabinose 1-dehydrogenase-like Zn-dependent alcohol dehydrogenase